MEAFVGTAVGLGVFGGLVEFFVGATVGLEVGEPVGNFFGVAGLELVRLFVDTAVDPIVGVEDSPDSS